MRAWWLLLAGVLVFPVPRTPPRRAALSLGLGGVSSWAGRAVPGVLAKRTRPLCAL